MKNAMNETLTNRRDFLRASVLAAASGMSVGCATASESNGPAASGNTPAAVPANLIASAPMLQNAAETSVCVVFEVTADASGWVEVSTSPDMSGAVRSYSGGTGLMTVDDKIACVRVTGLSPATRYWYRIGADRILYKHGYSMKNLGSEVDAKVRSFTTLGAAAEGAFAVINDTHDQKKTLDRVFAKLAEIKPATVLWNGDATNVTETRDHAVRIFLHAHKNHPEYASETPYLFVNGNHDLRGRFAREMDKLLMFRDPAERSGIYHDLGRNFVQRLGDIALIGLDTGEDKLDTNPLFANIFQMQAYREKQTRWLAEAIESPAVKTAKFKVAFCHIPLFDTRPDANPGDVFPADASPVYEKDYAVWQRTCANLWGPLFARAGVQLVVTAHQHCFRYDAPTADRPWAQIVGGGCELEGSASRFPTVIEGRVSGGRLVVTVHDLRHGTVAGEYAFS